MPYGKSCTFIVWGKWLVRPVRCTHPQDHTYFFHLLLCLISDNVVYCLVLAAVRDHRIQSAFYCAQNTYQSTTKRNGYMLGYLFINVHARGMQHAYA